MAKAEKKVAAKRLYMTGEYDLKQIAAMFGINAATVSTWNKEEGWSEEFDRDAKIVNDSEAIVRELIHHTLSVLKAKARRASKQLENGDIKDMADMEMISAKDVDGLSKLYAQIKRKELEFADKLKIIGDFLTFSVQRDPSVFGELSKLTNAYIEKISYKK